MKTYNNPESENKGKFNESNTLVAIDDGPKTLSQHNADKADTTNYQNSTEKSENLSGGRSGLSGTEGTLNQ